MRNKAVYDELDQLKKDAIANVYGRFLLCVRAYVYCGGSLNMEAGTDNTTLARAGTRQCTRAPSHLHEPPHY